MLQFLALLFLPLAFAGCPQDWFYFEETNSCYYWADYNDWSTAEKFCANESSHLASIHTKNELEFLKTIHNGDLWIGLYAKNIPINNNTTWLWTDGSTVDYLTWSGNGMPTIGGNGCVVSNGNFSNLNCSSPMYSICKKPSDAYCPDGWKFYEPTNSCYLIPTLMAFKYTWEEAKEWCVSIGAQLASVHSYEENEFLIRPYSGSPLWIGLSTKSTPVNWDSVWNWTDGSSVDYLRWSLGVPSLTNDLCVSLKGFAFENSNCLSEMYPLCKKASSKIVPTTPKPTTPSPSNCPTKWKYYEKTNSCYYYLSSPLNWTTSEAYCAFYGGAGGHLLSVHYADEYNFVKNYVQYAQYDKYFWTGLYSINNAVMWQWTDGTPFDYKIWANWLSDSRRCNFCADQL